MSQNVKKQEENRSCRLLQSNENNNVFDALGRRCITLSTTVVQLYECAPNDRNWQKKCVGVVCFVKDNPRKSYYIRIVNLSQKSVVWEQELYNQFKYMVNGPQFHSFEGDACVVGLNFADKEEANHFHLTIEDKLAAKQQRKMERRQTSAVRRPPAPPAPSVKSTLSNHGSSLSLNSTNSIPPPTISPSSSTTDLKNKKNKSKGKKPKLTKEDISTPTDFRHVGHVGWDPKAGFDVDNIDPQWKKLFDTVGVTQSELEDEATSKFIYDFVESHGGIEKATQELDKSRNQAPPPPPPSRSAPGLPSRAPPRTSAPPPPSSAPPPPSSRMPARTAPPPPPPGHSRGAPPPPSRGGPPPPPPPSSRAPPIPRGGPPPPPQISGGGGPPPPPPPPPSGGGPPPPPPPPPPQAPGGIAPLGGGGGPPPPPSMGRGGLLDQIHQGKQLKSVETNANRDSGGDRNSLLSDIRAGMKLKNVSDDDPRQSKQPEELEGMAGALAKALAQRSAHIQVSDDDDDDDDDFDDEDEWSD